MTAAHDRATCEVPKCFTCWVGRALEQDVDSWGGREYERERDAG
jgi:hypothetical protein